MGQHLIAIPFHDWRKCAREGFRTRDAHLIEAFARVHGFEKIIVVNRPMTHLELVFRREVRDPGRKAVLRGAKWHVIRDRGCYIFEYFASGSVRQALEGRTWFFGAYGSHALIEGLSEAMGELGIVDPVAMSMNIRSAQLAEVLHERRIPIVFDAWDNWLRFPLGQGERDRITEGYRRFASLAEMWFTNSEKNRLEFTRRFGVGRCLVVPNGVDLLRFRAPFDEPKKLKPIPRPRAFFGGKISHLFDAGLFNEVTRRLPRIQFVLAGQVLDRRLWRTVKRRRNVHYLGDIHYDEYPAYVKASDVCIAPYVPCEKDSGGDGIKLYEYAAAGRPTVSTTGNGAPALSAFVTIAHSPEGFAHAILKSIETGPTLTGLPESGFSWDERAQTMLGQFRGLPVKRVMRTVLR